MPLAPLSVRTALQTCGGELWIGTFSSGLVRVHEGVPRLYTVRDGLPSNSAKDLIEDRGGNIWIATYGGAVCRFSGGRLVPFEPGRFPSRRVRYIHEDQAGALWFATLGQGLVRYQGGAFRTFTTASGLLRDRVFPICLDREGNLWNGTEGGGLNRMCGDRIDSFAGGRAWFRVTSARCLRIAKGACGSARTTGD